MLTAGFQSHYDYANEGHWRNAVSDDILWKSHLDLFVDFWPHAGIQMALPGGCPVKRSSTLDLLRQQGPGGKKNSCLRMFTFCACAF